MFKGNKTLLNYSANKAFLELPDLLQSPNTQLGIHDKNYHVLFTRVSLLEGLVPATWLVLYQPPGQTCV